jgi:hypothetical protein
VFVKLTAVPSKDKELLSSPESMNAARKTSRFTGQTRQVMAQFSIIRFN